MSAPPVAAPAEAPAATPSLREQLAAAVQDTLAPATPEPAAPPPAAEPAAAPPAPPAAPPATPPVGPAPAPDLDALRAELADTRRVLDSVRGNVGQLAQERQRLLAELDRARTEPAAQRDREVDAAIAEAEQRLRFVTDPKEWQAARDQIDTYRAGVAAERRARDLTAKEQQLAAREETLTAAQAKLLRDAVPDLIDGYAEHLAAGHGLAKDALKPFLHAPTTQRDIRAALGAIGTFQDIERYLNPTMGLLATVAETLARDEGARRQAEAAQNRAAAAGDGAHRPEGGGASGAAPPQEIKTVKDARAELHRRLAAGQFG